MKKVAVILILASFALSGCGKKKTVNNTTFAGKNYGMKFPDTWEINDSGAMGTDIVGLSPVEGPSDKFRENINVVLENVPTSLPEKDYLDLSLKNLTEGLGIKPGLKFTKTKVGSAEGYHLHYTAKIGEIEVDNDLYIVIKNGGSYIITCSNSKGKRDAFKSVMDSVIATFSVE